LSKLQKESDSRAKPLRLLDLEFDATGPSSIAARNLRLLALETAEQHAALSELRAEGESNRINTQFQHHVLKLLALIADRMHAKGKTGVVSQRSLQTVRKIRNRAKRVRSLASVLQSPFGEALPDPPVAPIDELRHYAQELDAYAGSIQLGRDGLAPPLPVTPKNKKRFPRRTKTIENRLIIHLVGLVRKVTGNNHYDELTILLRRATGDRSYNNHRLQSLCWVNRKNEKRKGRMATAFARNRLI
jgi:hypothetical protein